MPPPPRPSPSSARIRAGLHRHVEQRSLGGGLQLRPRGSPVRVTGARRFGVVIHQLLRRFGRDGELVGGWIGHLGDRRGSGVQSPHLICRPGLRIVQHGFQILRQERTCFIQHFGPLSASGIGLDVQGRAVILEIRCRILLLPGIEIGDHFGEVLRQHVLRDIVVDVVLALVLHGFLSGGIWRRRGRLGAGRPSEAACQSGHQRHCRQPAANLR